MFRSCFIAAVLLLLAGCATTPQARTTPFIESDYAWASRPGTGAITGQAFLVTRGGEVKVAAGREVLLNPVTPYSTEWFDRAVVAGMPLEPPDERFRKYHRTVVGDAEGRFRFTGLPAGDYYVASWITWEYRPGLYSGGYAYSKATVREGATTDCVVTQKRP